MLPSDVGRFFEAAKAAALQKLASEREASERRRDRFKRLLERKLSGPEHVGVRWQDARRDLAGTSAYERLAKGEREALFEEHMAELRRKVGAGAEEAAEGPKEEEGEVEEPKEEKGEVEGPKEEEGEVEGPAVLGKRAEAEEPAEAPPAKRRSSRRKR